MTRRRFSTPDIPPCGCQISPSNTTGRTGIWLHARMRSCRSLHALAGPDICCLVKQIATIHFSKGLSTGRSLRRERHIICSSSSPWRNSMKLNHRGSYAPSEGALTPREPPTAESPHPTPVAECPCPVATSVHTNTKYSPVPVTHSTQTTSAFAPSADCQIPPTPGPTMESVGAPPLARAGKVRPDRLVRFLAVPPHLTCLVSTKRIVSGRTCLSGLVAPVLHST